MSFRLRVLLLVVLVAASATGATTWLSLRLFARQIGVDGAADYAQLDRVSDALYAYARRHGTWEGVAGLVADLHDQEGQRIYLRTDAGVVLADTDTQAGRTARALGSMVTLIDARPILPAADRTAAATLEAIGSYRTGVLYAACLTRVDLGVTVGAGRHGMPSYALDPADGDKILGDEPAGTVAASCRRSAAARGALTGTDRAVVADCANDAACLTGVFVNGITAVSPDPVRVYLGTGGAVPVPAAGPVLAAATGVLAVAAAATVLLSRRVLRPIRTLTAASGRLGAGDLSGRVPVSGQDELAGLARSFNRMADSLQAAEERQRRIVADVAHELRTPLVNLRGYLEALRDGVIEPGPELFASLHDEAVLQQRIVDDLQDLALAEAGRLAYHRVAVEVADLLETCRVAHLAAAEAGEVTLSVRAEPATVHGDPDRLRQAIGNLVTNALRACPAGAEVTLAGGTAGGSVVLCVADTGRGIAPDALPHVFDRFWRGDPARSRHTGGSGLGLSIARQIVADHGGTIEAASEPGRGSTFTITLPAAPPATLPAAS